MGLADVLNGMRNGPHVSGRRWRSIRRDVSDHDGPARLARLQGDERQRDSGLNCCPTIPGARLRPFCPTGWFRLVGPPRHDGRERRSWIRLERRTERAAQKNSNKQVKAKLRNPGSGMGQTNLSLATISKKPSVQTRSISSQS